MYSIFIPCKTKLLVYLVVDCRTYYLTFSTNVTTSGHMLHMHTQAKRFILSFILLIYVTNNNVLKMH